MMKRIVSASAFLLITACSSGEKKSESTQPATPPVKAVSTSKEDLTEKYSLVELNGAANFLKVVIDEGINAPAADKGSEIIGCAITARQAISMTMPIKSLIDQSVRVGAEAYSQNPKIYSGDHGFESCASTCACGVLSDVVEGANESAFPAGSERIHMRNQKRLQAKAAHQTAGDSLACAKKQTWFCGSDLRAYLVKEAHQSAE